MALEKVSDRDVRFAQTALNQLGYKLGLVDGIWGKRSARAMRDFEQSRNLETAGGALSELNLYALSKATKVRKSEIESSIKQSHSLRAKIDSSVPLSSAPQLIIIDKSYDVLAKANPVFRSVDNIASRHGYLRSCYSGWLV